MEKRDKRDLEKDSIERVEFEPLQDEDLKSITGGCSPGGPNSNTANSCCVGGHEGGYDN